MSALKNVQRRRREISAFRKNVALKHIILLHHVLNGSVFYFKRSSLSHSRRYIYTLGVKTYIIDVRCELDSNTIFIQENKQTENNAQRRERLVLAQHFYQLQFCTYFYKHFKLQIQLCVSTQKDKQNENK